jgi:hypothetical protein
MKVDIKTNINVFKFIKSKNVNSKSCSQCNIKIFIFDNINNLNRFIDIFKSL